MIRVRRRVLTLFSTIACVFILGYYIYIRSDSKWFPTYPYWLSGNILMKTFDEIEGFNLSRVGSPKANATLLSLVRNEELDDLLMTMKDVESTFNSKFSYPWTFINDKPFTEEFKKKTKALASAEVHYETIPTEHWIEPSWIEPELQKASAEFLKYEGVQYASMESYHRMCRWNSGMFVHHPFLENFRWYWRVEPKTHYFCSIDYDVFKFMEDNDKTYGFVINIYDSPESIRTLWPTTLEFISEHPEYIDPNSAIGWLTDYESRPGHNRIAEGYSTCHFWSNFEIGDMDFWRSKPYQDYFNHLDRAGGFFYERWGDAPV